MLAAPPTSARSRGRSLPLKGGGATPNLPSKGEGEDGGDDARICLGVVTGAHGVRGRVRVKSFTAEPHAIARYGALESEAGERRFELEITGPGKGFLIAHIDGVDDRPRPCLYQTQNIARNARPSRKRGQLLIRNCASCSPAAGA